MLTIILGRGEDKRVKSGHPWIFSNEIKEFSGDKEPGCKTEIYSNSGEFLGTGYYNPRSLIAARLLSRQRIDINSTTFFKEQIERAYAFRRDIYPNLATFRLVHGEGDFLPGLVVDKYGDYFSMQLLTSGMESRRELIISVLDEMFAPKGIIARNDVAVRGLEGLEEKVEILSGDIPDNIEMEEYSLRLRVNLREGQKTGHFLDQKENHQMLAGICAGKEVLDCFCYTGSWGLHAAAFGASSVTCLDISERAIALARENAELNTLAGSMRFEAVDVFDRLRSLKAEGRNFDVIVLDPPAFVKSKKALKDAEKGYLTINRRAMELLRPSGYLITCSCSYHMGREMFRDLLTRAAQQAGHTMRLVAVRAQAPDHPILLSVPETEYLKCYVLQRT